MDRANRAEESEEGNTDASSPDKPKTQGLQYSYWSWTLNNYAVEQIEHLKQVLKHECKWYVFQEEIGEQGTPHLQGTLCLKVRQRMTQLKPIDQKIRWSPTKSVRGSFVYCIKKETAIGKIYYHGIEIPEQVEVTEPYG